MIRPFKGIMIMSKIFEIATQKEIAPLYVALKNAVEKGRFLTVEVKSKASKTKEQLGYYWDVVLPRIQARMREDGNELSLAEINQFLNEKFFCVSKTFTWKVGRDEHVHTIITPKSKSGASKDQMAEFLDKVIRWASTDLNVSIPEPVKNPSQVPF